MAKTSIISDQESNTVLPQTSKKKKIIKKNINTKDLNNVETKKKKKIIKKKPISEKNTNKDIEISESDTKNHSKKKKIIKKIQRVETNINKPVVTTNVVKKKKIVKIPKSNYKKFIEYCNKYSIEYFKYTNTFKWSGPAFVINSKNQISLDDVKSETGIDLKYEEFARNDYIVYPKNFEDPNKFTYPFKVDDNDKDKNTDDYGDETLVIEWTFNGTTYFCDEDTGNLYNQDEEYIGKRCIDKGKFNIKFD